MKGWETGKTATMYGTFYYPVEDIIQGLPAYAEVIKKPIDLIKIKAKIDNMEYDGIDQLNEDLKLMTTNAKTFNPPEHPAHVAALQWEQLWEEKMSQLPPLKDTNEAAIIEEFDNTDEAESNSDQTS
jgi:hypothetical protein